MLRYLTRKKIRILKKLFESFESGDTLEPLRYLAQFKESDSSVFLVEEPLHEKIKTQVTYAIGIIPVALTIIDRVVKLIASASKNNWM